MLIPENAFGSDGPTDAETKAATVKALSELNHADTLGTYETLFKANPIELKRVVACHHGSSEFGKKIQEMCKSHFAQKKAESARIFITISESLSPHWPDANLEPKKTAQKWLDKMDQADGAITDTNMISVYKENDNIRIMAFTNQAERMLRNSGKEGVFVSAANDEADLRDGYVVVWGRGQVLLPKMLDACDSTTLGLAYSWGSVGWRVRQDQEDAFRKKVGIYKAGKIYEVGPLPTHMLGDNLIATLKTWGWAGVSKIRCRREPKQACTWIVRAKAPPTSYTVVLGGTHVAHIKVAPPTRDGLPAARQPAARAVTPEPQAKPATPPKRVGGTRTYAQVAAGALAGKPQGPMPRSTHEKMGMQLEQITADMAKMEARLEQKANQRIVALEKKMAGEKAEMAAKIDAIFSFIQQSTATAPPPSVPEATPKAQDGGPSQKKRRASRTLSETSEWGPIDVHDEEEAPQEKKGRRTKALAAKPKAKTLKSKRTRRRSDH